MKAHILILLLLVVTFSFCDECKLKLNKEYPEPEEQVDVKEIAALVVKTINETYVQKGEFVRRDAHPKAHGCPRAIFKVLDNIPSEFRHGIFTNSSQSYKAYIRFSNGSPSVNHDLRPDSRGFALKLLGVHGKKLLEDEQDATTQDFVGANKPEFFLSTTSDYLTFFKMVRRGGLDLIKWLIGGQKFREVNAARKFIFTVIGNVLSTQYFSATPYRLGPEVTVKWSVQPVDCYTGVPVSDRLPGMSNDYLTERLKESLNAEETCFDFLVQKQENACEQPMEDPVTEWTTPFVRLARITVPVQELDQSEEGKLFCENLSFSPWHSLEAHQPLGNVNRARKVVYRATSSFRHAQNHEPRVEPKEW
ncbi:hypothetical protein AKO1_006850 [Acrasis kona]|uniref:Catalase n=1 Tax=Acrasis kona TaxID=1008807 RepID=A0AAW2YUN9_9EUKA